MDKIGTKRNYYCSCFCLVVLFVFRDMLLGFSIGGWRGDIDVPYVGLRKEGSYVGESWVKLVMFKDVDLKHYPLWLVGGFWEVWWWQWQWLLFLLLWVRGIFV